MDFCNKNFEAEFNKKSIKSINDGKEKEILEEKNDFQPKRYFNFMRTSNLNLFHIIYGRSL